MKKLVIILLFSISALSNTVEFITPKDGEKVKSPFKVKMDVKGLKIRPAGEDVDDKKTGHHHILIDMDGIPEGQAIPADDKHLHYGKGQTEAEVTLPPGEHKITLQFADGAHRSYGPKMSKTIKITVVK